MTNDERQDTDTGIETGPETDSRLEKRQHPRQHFTLSVNLNRGGIFSSNRARDISLSGIFVETAEDFSPGQEVQLTIPFTNQDRHIRMKGRVARVTDDGIGVQFDIYSIDIE